MKKVTLLFLRDKDQILLAMKKRGFGVNRYNGVGGKVEQGESIEQAVIRECQEEISVTPQDIKKVAEIDFYFPEGKADWNQQVSVYICSKWLGEPMESEEMKPEWFNIKDIPYDKMWSDDKFWLPKVLEDKFVTASFEFDDDDNFIEDKVKISY